MKRSDLFIHAEAYIRRNRSASEQAIGGGAGEFPAIYVPLKTRTSHERPVHALRFFFLSSQLPPLLSITS